MRLIGALNVLLGVMAAFSALLSLLIVILQATPNPQRFVFFAVLLTAAAVTGIISGWSMVQQIPARLTSLVFGLLLSIFVITDSLLEQSMPLRLLAVLAYGLTICGLSLRTLSTGFSGRQVPTADDERGIPASAASHQSTAR